jgi:hypothetical protein
MKKILLSKNQVTIVDDEDFPVLSRYKWHVSFQGKTKSPYAQGYVLGHPVRMQRLILNPSAHLEVDHINGDTLDNRKANLRICTHAENLLNANVVGKCGYKGVYEGTGKVVFWYARLRGKTIGRFSNARAAAMAYDKAAEKAFGEYAWLNYRGVYDDEFVELCRC